MRDHNDVIEFSCCNDIMIRDSTTPLRIIRRRQGCLAQWISIKNYIAGINAYYKVGLKLQENNLLFSFFKYFLFYGYHRF